MELLAVEIKLQNFLKTKIHVHVANSLSLHAVIQHATFYNFSTRYMCKPNIFALFFLQPMSLSCLSFGVTQGPETQTMT